MKYQLYFWDGEKLVHKEIGSLGGLIRNYLMNCVWFSPDKAVLKLDPGDESGYDFGVFDDEGGWHIQGRIELIEGQLTIPDDKQWSGCVGDTSQEIYGFAGLPIIPFDSARMEGVELKYDLRKKGEGNSLQSEFYKSMVALTKEKTEFITYLQYTLIPDLRESGQDGLVEDFEKCIRFM